MAELQDVQVVAEGLAFPEGPVAMADGTVVVVELNAGRLTRCCPDGKVSLVADVGGHPAGLAVGPDRALYVCNTGGTSPAGSCPPCIQRVDSETGEAAILYTEAEGVAFGGPDDLVFDHTGSFWFTDLRGNAILYGAPDGSRVVRALNGTPYANGIGLSPDESVLYWAQTYTRQVIRRRLSAPGEMVPSPGCSIASLVEFGRVDWDCLLVGLPGAQELDSLAVDSSGAVCVGTLVDSGITVIPAGGGPVEKLTLPERVADGAVTNICFGGPDLGTAFITLSLTGRLISCRWPRPGLRLAFQD